MNGGLPVFDRASWEGMCVKKTFFAPHYATVHIVYVAGIAILKVHVAKLINSRFFFLRVRCAHHY